MRLPKSFCFNIALGLTLLLSACSSAPSVETTFKDIPYPPPPEQARFNFEFTLTDSSQITVDPKEARMRRLITGEHQRGHGMAKPYDVAVCEGTVYVSDTVERVVHAFDFVRSRYYRIGESEEGELVKPLGLAVDRLCNLYVADGSQSRVVVFDQEGGYLTALGGSAWFERLSHVTVDPEGQTVFAVDTGGVLSDQHMIRVFDVNSGEHSHDIGSRGNEKGQFNLPRDIAFGKDGRLYIVDSGNFRIQVLEADGEVIKVFGEVGDTWGHFSRPKGIALDPDGNIYVSDASFANFQIFNPDGRLLLHIGDRSNTPRPAGYLLPAGIDVDSDGRVYFVGQFFRKIDIFRPAALSKSDGFLGAFFTD